jgi:hypothetical protein
MGWSTLQELQKIVLMLYSVYPSVKRKDGKQEYFENENANIALTTSVKELKKKKLSLFEKMVYFFYINKCLFNLYS